LRHISHSFTVEVKRHRGRPSNSDTKPVLSLGLAEAVRNIEAESNKGSKRLLSEAFESGSREVPKSLPGRVLPSLIESAQWTFPPDGSGLRNVGAGGRAEEGNERKKRSAAQKRRRTPNAEAPAHVDASEPSIDTDSVEPSWDMVLGVSGARPKKTVRRRKRVTPTLPDQSFESFIDDTLDEDASTARALEEAAQSHQPDASVAAEETNGARNLRRRKILGRYVFGTEPKLGERWRKRFRKPR
jgi:hypothetical protein